LGDLVQRVVFEGVAQQIGKAADGIVLRYVVFLPGEVAAVVAGVEEDVTGIVSLMLN
jgi:hypothetical protein